MRTYDAASAAYLATRPDLIVHYLYTITAENLTTELSETLRICTYEQDLTVTIEGTPRTFIGAPALRPQPFQAGPGLDVRFHEIHLAGASPLIENLVKGYNTAFAPVEIHRAFFDPGSHQLVSEPHKRFQGTIDSIDFPDDAAPGSDAVCVVYVAGASRALTRTLGRKKSLETDRRTGVDDIRKYADVSGSVPVFWGTKRASGSGETGQWHN